jgi:hypothetical protein
MGRAPTSTFSVNNATKKKIKIGCKQSLVAHTGHVRSAQISLKLATRFQWRCCSNWRLNYRDVLKYLIYQRKQNN